MIDARIGGDVMSLTQAHLDAMGVSKESGEARDRGMWNMKVSNSKTFLISMVLSEAVTVFQNTTCTMQRMYACVN